VHACVDETTGPKLQQLIRRGSVENSERASMILDSGLGASIDELCERYSLPRPEIENLIVRFNALGMRGIQIRKAPAVGSRYLMNDAEKAIVQAMIDLTPKFFGRPDDRWLADELCEELDQRQLVGVLDRNVVQTLLDAARAKIPKTRLTYRPRH